MLQTAPVFPISIYQFVIARHHLFYIVYFRNCDNCGLIFKLRSLIGLVGVFDTLIQKTTPKCHFHFSGVLLQKYVTFICIYQANHTCIKKPL